MPYQTVGTLHLDFEGISKYDDYYRDLDIEKAIATTRFTANGVTYVRETFTSFPDRLLVIRLTASKKEAFLSLRITPLLIPKHRAPHLFPQRIATQRKGQRPRRH